MNTAEIDRKNRRFQQNLTGFGRGNHRHRIADREDFISDQKLAQSFPHIFILFFQNQNQSQHQQQLIQLKKQKVQQLIQLQQQKEQQLIKLQQQKEQQLIDPTP